MNIPSGYQGGHSDNNRRPSVDVAYRKFPEKKTEKRLPTLEETKEINDRLKLSEKTNAHTQTHTKTHKDTNIHISIPPDYSVPFSSQCARPDCSFFLSFK